MRCLHPAQQSATQEGTKPRYTAEDIQKAKPSGTIELSAKELGLLVGGGKGKGVLHYRGKSYPLTITSADVGTVGYTKTNAKGNVYFLKTLDDFPGTYSKASVSGTLYKGAGGAQFQNDKGVFLSVVSKSEGAAVSLGIGGMKVEFAK